MPFSLADYDQTTGAQATFNRLQRESGLGKRLVNRGGGMRVHPMLPSQGTGMVAGQTAGTMGSRADFYNQVMGAPLGRTEQLSRAQDRVGVDTADRRRALVNMYLSGSPTVGDSGEIPGMDMRNQARDRFHQGMLGRLREISPYYTPQLQSANRAPLTEEQVAAGAMNRQAYLDKVAGRRANVVANAKGERSARQARMQGQSQPNRLMMLALGGSRPALQILQGAMDNQRSLSQSAMQMMGLADLRQSEADLNRSRVATEEFSRGEEGLRIQRQRMLGELVGAGVPVDQALGLLGVDALPSVEGAVPDWAIEEGVPREPDDLVQRGRAQGLSDTEIERVLSQLHPGSNIRKATRGMSGFLFDLISGGTPTRPPVGGGY